MRPRLKVWLEDEAGQVGLSDWRVALLEAIERHGSLVAAAREIGVPHRTAWERVREMEERLGTPLVETSSGGAAGGASRLTADGQALVGRFRMLTRGLEELLAARFEEQFGRWRPGD